jgi:hypothetical protein
VELLFVVLLGFCIGLAIRTAIPGHDTYGSALVPSIAAAVSAVVWVILTWSGWKFDGGWIWVVSLVSGGIVALILALVIPRSRRTNDQAMLQQLSKPAS